MAENENNLPTGGDSSADATGGANETTNSAVNGNDAMGDTSVVAEEATGEASDSSTESVEEPEVPVSTEEITYHAVEKDGHVTAIWEMQGRKHLRTIDPRSRQGQEILRLYTSEHHDEIDPAHAQEATATEDAPVTQDAAPAQ